MYQLGRYTGRKGVPGGRAARNNVLERNLRKINRYWARSIHRCRPESLLKPDGGTEKRHFNALLHDGRLLPGQNDAPLDGDGVKGQQMHGESE